MTGTFSFLKHPMLHLVKDASVLVPGIEKCMVVYNDGISGIVCKSNKGAEAEGLIEDYDVISDKHAEKIRSQGATYGWLSADSLPFEAVKSNSRQFDIFDELDHVVLSLGFKSIVDGKTDVLYLYLNPKLNNFGTAGKGGLTTNDKSIVGAMLKNTFTYIYNQHISDASVMNQLSVKYKQVQEENKDLSSKLEELQGNYHANIVDVCKRHMQVISQKYGSQFVLTDDAISKIEEFTGNTDKLKLILENAAIMLLNMDLGMSERILINSWDIQFVKVEELKLETDVQERYQKTFLLLEKLEQASRTVVNNNQKLTGENVGNACPQPISAPAISDALKNHHKKVVSLMQQYPERWKTIRNEFRPVKNILNEKAG